MHPDGQNTCYLRKIGEPVTDEFRQLIFDQFYGEGASEITQVRIVTTYLFNVWLIDWNLIVVIHC